MISWIQRSFQHHFRIIFAVLLVGMVIPFIFTIGSTPGVGRPDHKTADRDFFGHNLLSRDDNIQLVSDTRISAELQYGTEATPDQIQYYMLQRVASKHLADELHLPEPTAADITTYIKTLRMFAGSDGQFDVARYDEFRSSFKANSAVTEGDIARVISDDVRMIRLQRLIAGPGYVLPADVREILQKGDTTWTLSTITADYAGFEPNLTVSDAELTKFFSDNVFRYTVAPRVSVDAIQFPLTQYAAQVTVSDPEVRAFYDSNPARFPKPAVAKGVTVAADPSKDFAAVQAQARSALVAEKARQLAVKAASDLAFALYDGKVTHDSLASFLASHNLKADSIAPFTADAGPAEFGGDKQLASAAFALSADRFYSEGLPTPAGAAVLIWKELLPSREPALAEIREKVVADAVDNKRRIAFVEFGRTLKAGILRRMKEGTPFEAAAQEAASPVRVTVKSYPPFTLRAQPKDIDPSVLASLENLDKGALSDMEATADKGVLVYAADKKLPVVNETNPLYAQTKARLADTFARTVTTSDMREIVDNELKRTEMAAK
ncbi:MAG TPA: peptidyl-prolyl cis-trans isomerase [Opitutaceae bacterium]